MRQLALLALALLACGGSPASTSPTTPAAAPAPAADPAPPAPPPADAPLTVAEYDGMADQLCACADLGCAHPRQQAMWAAAKRPRDEADRSALAATYNRAMMCYARLLPPPPNPS